jgi:hypothetical protein
MSNGFIVLLREQGRNFQEARARNKEAKAASVKENTDLLQEARVTLTDPAASIQDKAAAKALIKDLSPTGDNRKAVIATLIIGGVVGVPGILIGLSVLDGPGGNGLTAPQLADQMETYQTAADPERMAKKAKVDAQVLRNEGPDGSNAQSPFNARQIQSDEPLMGAQKSAIRNFCEGKDSRFQGSLADGAYEFKLPGVNGGPDVIARVPENACSPKSGPKR